MTETLLVTGATGSVGSNVCLQAAGAGWRVRALVRDRAAARPLADLGVELHQGDVRDPSTLRAASQGADRIIHAAAQIGGTWTTATAEDFVAVNQLGTANVLDAAEVAGVSQVVVLLSAVVLDHSRTVTEESAITPIGPGNSPYTRSKLAAYYDGMARAARGSPVTFVIPGGIYGPTPLVERALVPTIFTHTLLSAANGELDAFLPSLHTWVLASEVAAISISAAERGRSGARYLAMGPPQDVMSLPAFCNRFLKMAAIDRTVEEVDVNDPSTRPGLEARFGSMVKYLRAEYPDPYHDPRATTAELGVEPIRVNDGLRVTLDWLVEQGRIRTAG
jgi:dihydroflavonol-4-reductase